MILYVLGIFNIKAPVYHRPGLQRDTTLLHDRTSCDSTHVLPIQVTWLFCEEENFDMTAWQRPESGLDSRCDVV